MLNQLSERGYGGKKEGEADNLGNQNRFTIPITSRPHEDVTSKFPNCWSMEEEC